MKRKEIISALFLAAAVMAVSPGLTWSQSVGGTQSERSGGDSQTPLPKGSRSAGTEAGQRSTASGLHGMSGAQDVRQAQEALKNQGHDPGPIDGVMGSQTRQALREFQSKNGLKQTGTLDAETKQKLNIESAGSSPTGRGDSSMRQRESSSPMGK
jgi:peptidoglycan hydrolase-like protein with peptidoglycan-binding domain